MTDDAIRRELREIKQALEGLRSNSAETKQSLALMRAEQTATHRTVSYLRRILAGDDRGEGGLILRVDRLEQTQRRWGRWIWAIGGAALAGLADVVRRMLGGG